ncbi:MAG: carboxypeptidase regulatory-like domain-containing protein [Ruminococcus sp.]|nr:carboxypeptidase regulatory-like domain-containing protein [Ruminococcus sp.]
MKFINKRAVSLLSACAIAVGSIAAAGFAPKAKSFVVTVSAETENGLYTDNNIVPRTQAQIIDYFNNHPFYTSKTGTFGNDTFATQPVHSGGTFVPGELSTDSKQAGLNALNTIRYVAGLGEVTLDADYGELAQCGALADAAIDTLTHFPTNDANMPEELFNKGYKGTSQSNIAQGFYSIAASMVWGWIEDADDYNIPMVGHRRWVLNPGMAKTGFGHVDDYTAMYSFDRTNSTTGYTVAWPSANTPVELFNTSTLYSNRSYPVWSVSKNSAFSSDTVVTLTRKSDNKVWTFSNSAKDGDFYINNDWYGQPGCVIFRPNGITDYEDAEVFTVSITDGSYSLTYDVNFFSLPEDTGVIGAVHSQSYDITLNTTDAALLQKTPTVIIEEYEITANDGSFTLPRLESGEYEITITAEGFAPRTQTITVTNGAITSSPELSINPLGDADLNGIVNTNDITAIKKHLKKTATLDGYALVCANADQDTSGTVNTGDITRIKQHLKKTKPLW